MITSPIHSFIHQWTLLGIHDVPVTVWGCTGIKMNCPPLKITQLDSNVTALKREKCRLVWEQVINYFRVRKKCDGWVGGKRVLEKFVQTQHRPCWRTAGVSALPWTSQSSVHLFMPAIVRSTEGTLSGTVEVQLLWGGKVEGTCVVGTEGGRWWLYNIWVSEARGDFDTHSPWYVSVPL